jgi:hypothetical protein
MARMWVASKTIRALQIPEINGIAAAIGLR